MILPNISDITVMTAKSWKLSKMIFVNTLAIALATLEANIGLVRDQFGAESYLLILVALAAINNVLRFVTSQPIK